MTDTVVVTAPAVVVVVDPGGVATAIVSQAVQTHEASPNPHPQYAAVLAAHAADPRAHGLTGPDASREVASRSDAARAVQAHDRQPSAHPDRPTHDQAVMAARFFGA